MSAGFVNSSKNMIKQGIFMKICLFSLSIDVSAVYRWTLITSESWRPPWIRLGVISYSFVEQRTEKTVNMTLSIARFHL